MKKRHLEKIMKIFKSADIESIYVVSDSSRVKLRRLIVHIQVNSVTKLVLILVPNHKPVQFQVWITFMFSIWLRPFGKSDGTSNESSTHFDGYCGHETVMKPAPETTQ